MEQAIRSFHTQFAWKPAVQNAGALKRKKRFIVAGMGGSHLAANLLSLCRPKLSLSISSDYGLPPLSDADLKDSLFIASSYSGNTEETIDFAKVALKKGYAVATISVGGELLKLAEKHKLPHIILPDTGIQPRSALGFSLLALAKLIGDEKLLTELQALSKTLKPEAFEKSGKVLAQTLVGKVPVIYASTRNFPIAYNWKIKLNETGKVPAFYNVLPELNHNEMTGFDVISTTEPLSKNFHFVFLSDSADHPKIQKRMAVCRKLYEERGLSVTEVPISGASLPERMFQSLITADWTALHKAGHYGAEAEQVPMVEEFKRLID